MLSIEAGARGGDLVILDVRSGELLAVASLRTDSVTHKLKSTSSALVEPNEPGSTSKLFTVAALLRTGADTTPVDGEGGHWMMPIGRGKPRKIDDVHHLTGPVTLGETVKYSSNIAISKFSLRLQPEQQYRGDSRLRVRHVARAGVSRRGAREAAAPRLWVNHLLTQPSLGQGYEWEASAVQLAVGYGAIANHGVLMAPTLLREVHDEHGAVTWRHQPDTVRRAVPDSIARVLMTYLKAATDSGGTGTKAQLDAYKVAGKTGTAKVKSGGYRASFVGIFSADNPSGGHLRDDRPSVEGQVLRWRCRGAHRRIGDEAGPGAAAESVRPQQPDHGSGGRAGCPGAGRGIGGNPPRRPAAGAGRARAWREPKFPPPPGARCGRPW